MLPSDAGAGPLWIRPDWPAPPGVRALMSTRHAGSLRLDATDAQVDFRRRRFADELGATPVWLHQVHGTDVALLDDARPQPGRAADASVSSAIGVGCTVFAADCLPVLLCSDDGRAVGAAHAGWRGLAGGVLQAAIAALCRQAGRPPSALLAWLGPCIGPRQFEVGADVLLAFGVDPQRPSDAAFVRRDRPDGQARWLADLPALARQRLQAAGVQRISGGAWCTVEDRESFFSYRRDGPTGRMAASVWRLPA